MSDHGLPFSSMQQRFIKSSSWNVEGVIVSPNSPRAGADAAHHESTQE